MKIRRFRQIVTVVTTATAIGACIEIQRRILESVEKGSDYEVIGLIIAFVVSVTVSYVSADFITAMLLKLKPVRRWLFGHMWIEGTWIFDVYENGLEIRNELARIAYEGPDMDITVQTRAFRRGEGDFTSVSSNIVLDNNLSYINYFASQDSPGTVLGLAVGNFTHAGAEHPKKYRGQLFYRDSTPDRTEQAERIPDSIVNRIKRAHGDDWEIQLMRELRPSSVWNYRAGDLAVRRAKPTDIDEIVEIATMSARSNIDPKDANNLGYLVSDYTIDDYKQFLEFADYFYVILQGDVCVGYLMAYSDYRIPDNDHIAYRYLSESYGGKHFVLINQVCVRPQLRRKGIAHQLYSTLKREAEGADLLAAIIVDPPNRASTTFHDSEGFEEIGCFLHREYGKSMLYRQRNGE